MSSCPSGFLYTVRPGDSLWQIAQRFHTSIPEIVLLNPELDINNLSIGQTLCIPQEYNPYKTPMQPVPFCISTTEQTLSNHLRMLWEQHVYWTRLLILSMAFELPNTDPVANRLLRNPKDFEAALKRFYGEDLAAKFSELFTSHLTIAVELVKSAKAGDSTAAADTEKRWYANATQIATFLGKINPYWSAQAWQKILYDHLAMTKSEAVYFLTQKYADTINVFEKIEQEALIMADMMTQGIVKQFPKYFI
ncbi:LysM peptidoglycan-binding domain-containing protein [Oscillospiraceae bacterium LTW-04]|nr:LysM peptidoglycan-binding domain-containing protein [Oscillospiraceae bacterium MB24-C1]